MKIDVTQVLKNYEGKPIFESRIKRDEEGRSVKDSDGENVLEEVELTLRSVITGALLSDEPNKPRTAENKNKADQINRKVWEKSVVDFTVKQAGYISERVAIFYNPLVLGRVDELFEGGASEPEEKSDKETPQV